MKKLLFSVCMSVFALSLSVSFTHAMEAPKEFERLGGMKRVRPIDDVQQLVNIAQPHPLESLYIPKEMWGHMILFTLTMEPTSLPNVLLVCKEWKAVTKSLPVPLHPWGECLTDTIVGQFTNLTDLDLRRNKNITDESVKCLRNLTSLMVYETPYITDSSIKLLTNLTSLGADSCNITDESVQWLRNLTSLESSENPYITDSSIKLLTNLTVLSLILMDKITDEGMKPLIKLKYLELTDNENMTGVFLQEFEDLTSLDLHGDKYIRDESIKNLVSLTSLNLENNNEITNEGVMLLTNLRQLKLADSRITNDGISHLRNLTYLKIEDNETITDKAISLLTNLTILDVEYNPIISWLGIRHLTNLTDWVELKGGQYGQDFVDYFEQDAPDFGMWDNEAVQAYAELIEEYPQFSDIMGEKENREALEKLFKEKGLDSQILKEVFQFQKDQRQKDKLSSEQQRALEELETLTMEVDDGFPSAG